MEVKNLFETVVVIIAAFAAVGGGLGGLYAAARSRRVTALKGDLEDCARRHDEANKELGKIRADLDAVQDQLNGVKDIPLQEIAKHMQKTNDSLEYILVNCPSFKGIKRSR